MCAPKFVEYMLNDAIQEGDINEVRKIWRRICEAKSRLLAVAAQV